MLKIEKECDECATTLRLTGRIRSEHIEAIQAELDDSKRAVLNLAEVTLVDVDVVRFLGECAKAGTELIDCPRYIQEWIARERAESGR